MRRRLGFLVVALLLSGAVGRAAESLRIVPINSDDRLVVTVELADGYTDDVRQAIASGLRTTFTYTIDLRMLVPGWVDRTVATSTVSLSDQYDNLTRRHTLQRVVDGRIDETLVTEDDATVRQWLTTLTRLPLVRTTRLDAGRDYYVRISAQARPRGSSLLGLASAVTGQAKFTLIR
ncbi:MAG: DUF4390 domain-containing protein [Vicinamibacterales bacterium]